MINHAEKMLSIKKYLARFETYVRISNLNNEYDINKYSEDFLIPLLKIAYNWDLINLNREEKNAKALDLLDLKRKVGIQVTSETSIDKIKSTLLKYSSSSYKNKVSKIYFFFLQPKQKRYSEEGLKRVVPKKMNFQTNTNIIDCADLYIRISGLTFEKIDEAELLLRSQFSDFNIVKSFSYKDYEEFKEKYKSSCFNNYSRLNFFGLSIPKKPREIELYSLFVEPNFSIKEDDLLPQQVIEFVESQNILNSEYKNSKGQQFYRMYRALRHVKNEGNIQFKHLFGVSKNIVILGNPGAGKSSLIKYSICKILEEDRGTFESSDIYFFLPIRIELHKYNRFKKQGLGGIFEYVINNLTEEFQLPVEKEKIDFFLRNFPVLFFFDGLDEIFDIQDRVNVRNDIENFIDNNKIIRSVITCRYESYEEVQFKHKYFKIINVEDFNNDKITQYVNRWYEIEEINSYVRTQEIRGCLDQLKSVNEELKQNPLLLSLILILYRNEQDLPTSKLEIYEGCSQTLVDSRDSKEKKLDIHLKVSNKVSIFSNLAYWQFQKEIKKEETKIDYSSVKNFVSDHLIRKGEFEERELAEEAAIEFLDFAKVRSIYFENKFTHKTFYEYFIANYLFTNYYSKPQNRDLLGKIITENIGVASWHVVLELLICKIDQNQIDFEEIDSIIYSLLSNKPDETSYFFSSMLKHLRNVSPAKLRLIIENIISFLSQYEKHEAIVVKACFENFISLLKVKKLRDSFLKILEKRISANPILDEKLLNFLLELNHNGNFKEIENWLNEIIIKEIGIDLQCKMFILKNSEGLCEKNRASKLFETFISQFGKDLTLHTFYSNYGATIFNGNPKFNWVSQLYNQVESEAEMELLTKRITAQAITLKDIQVTLNENFSILSPRFYYKAGKSQLKRLDPKHPLYLFYKDRFIQTIEIEDLPF